MKKFLFIKKLLFSPGLLSLILALPFIIYFITGIEKYTINTTWTGTYIKAEELSYWADVNGDGYCEQIQTFRNRAGNAAVIIRNKEDNAVGQWNLETKLHPDIFCRALFLGDLSGDSLADIALLTRDENKIYLDVIFPMNHEQTQVKHFFVDSIHYRNGKTDYCQHIYLHPVNLCDSSGPGILFSIKAGFSQIPRKLYYFSLKNHSLIKSKQLSYTNSYAYVFDTDGDGCREILLSQSSPGNASDTEKVFPNDHYCWLTLLDHRLDLKLEPVSLGGIFSRLTAYAFKEGPGYFFLCALREVKNDTSYYSLHLFDKNGKKIKDTLLVKNPQARCNFDMIRNRLYFTQANLIYQVNHDLSLTKALCLDNYKSFYFYKDNILFNNCQKNSGNISIGFNTEDLELILLDFQSKDHIPLDIYLTKNKAFSLCRIEDLNGNMQFAVQNDQVLKKFAICKTMLFRLRYLVILLIYLSALVLVLIIRKTQSIQLKRKYEEQRQLSVLKARALKNQVGPHFTLNALSAITCIMQKDPDKAQRYIIKFSRLIQHVLSRSEDVFTTLGQELELVTDYLDMQQLRFPGLFEYQVILDDELIKSEFIPKMIIQTFSENAVRHGLRLKDKDGLIVIKIARYGKGMKISVSDNGVGRKAAKKNHTTHTNTGMKIIEQLIDIVSAYSGEKIKYAISDLYTDEGLPAGTRVEIWLPFFCPTFSEG